MVKIGMGGQNMNLGLIAQASGGKEESAKLATVMAHEGSHAYGNRIEGKHTHRIK